MTDLVVARYEEDVSWLDDVDVDRIFLYNKGRDVPQLKKKVIYSQLKNWGRESDTYLTHVLAHYHDMSDITIFVQGNPFDHFAKIERFISLPTIKDMATRLRTLRQPNETIFVRKDLVSLGNVWDINAASLDEWDRYSWFFGMMEVMEVLFGHFCLPMNVIAGWGAQFAISKDLLRRFTFNQYQKLKVISDKNYFLPWGLEKYWLFLFTATQEDFVVRDKLYMHYF